MEKEEGKECHRPNGGDSSTKETKSPGGSNVIVIWNRDTNFGIYGKLERYHPREYISASLARQLLPLLVLGKLPLENRSGTRLPPAAAVRGVGFLRQHSQ